MIGSERHSPPPGATDEDGGREWSLAPPVYLITMFYFVNDFPYILKVSILYFEFKI